jgi:hypothetical protein
MREMEHDARIRIDRRERRQILISPGPEQQASGNDRFHRHGPKNCLLPLASATAFSQLRSFGTYSEHNQRMPTDEPTPPYNRDAIFDADGPINPVFMLEAIRTLLRALPIDENEPKAWRNRRMVAALMSLAALHPRDEIEVMLAVQALCAYHAAASCWHQGMNHSYPRGSGLRQFSAAASAARTFDTLLKALERRQAKPLSVPVGRPAPRAWPDQDVTAEVTRMEVRCRRGEEESVGSTAEPEVAWTPDALAAADAMLERARAETENAGLDIAHTDGILPGGGMIVPENPTPQQDAYLARRLGLSVTQERVENLRNGIDVLPKIRPLRPGDFVP